MNIKVNIIDEFDGKYKFLSNYFDSKIVLDGISYPTVEHVFQAYKTLDIEVRKRIALAKSPGEAKQMGRQVKLRSDWETIKFNLMYDLILFKFTFHDDLRELLVATGDAVLIEGNWWGDTVWGVCNGVGENHLGKILMQVRAQSKHES